jgi:transcriptional regulator GlxA family with amidase domain
MRAATDQAAMLRCVVERLSYELGADRAGASLMTRHLAGIMFVLLLRDFAVSDNSPPAGWLRAPSDSKIGAALKLMHSDVSRRWTVERLAQEVGLSPSEYRQLAVGVRVNAERPDGPR